MPVEMKGIVTSYVDLQGSVWGNIRASAEVSPQCGRYQWVATSARGHALARLEGATFQAGLPLADDPWSDFKSCNHFRSLLNLMVYLMVSIPSE